MNTMEPSEIEDYVKPEVFDLYYSWQTDDIPF